MRSVYKHSWKTLTAGSLFCFSFIPERVTTADNNQDLGWNRGVIRFPLFMLPEDSLVLSFCGKPIFDAYFLTCKCIKLDLNWSGRTIIDACKRRKVHFGVSALPWWNCETARRARKNSRLFLIQKLENWKYNFSHTQTELNTHRIYFFQLYFPTLLTVGRG